jgi:hypothetical protein
LSVVTAVAVAAIVAVLVIPATTTATAATAIAIAIAAIVAVLVIPATATATATAVAFAVFVAVLVAVVVFVAHGGVSSEFGGRLSDQGESVHHLSAAAVLVIKGNLLLEVLIFHGELAILQLVVELHLLAAHAQLFVANGHRVLALIAPLIYLCQAQGVGVVNRLALESDLLQCGGTRSLLRCDGSLQLLHLQAHVGLELGVLLGDLRFKPLIAFALEIRLMFQQTLFSAGSSVFSEACLLCLE